MWNKISFEISEINGGALSVTPCIDGIPLTTLVAEFEDASGYTDPAGGYGGLIPSYFNFGPLVRYFCGPEDNQDESDNNKQIYVLGCECGELGCWPLMASVTPVEAGYRWAGFNQPFRPQRDYDAFGPFVFERGQYEAAVRDAARRSEPAS